MTYGGEHLAGADAVVEAHPGVVVGVLSGAEDVLVAHVVRLLIGHPVSPADTEGVTAPDVPEGVHAVTAALPVAALEVAALVEDDLDEGERKGARITQKKKQKKSKLFKYPDEVAAILVFRL